MRQSKVFSIIQKGNNGLMVGGSSHPELSERIAERLGMQLGDAALGKFSNGEKSVEIRSSLKSGEFLIWRLFGKKSGCVYCTIGIGNVCPY